MQIRSEVCLSVQTNKQRRLHVLLGRGNKWHSQHSAPSTFLAWNKAHRYGIIIILYGNQMHHNSRAVCHKISHWTTGLRSSDTVFWSFPQNISFWLCQRAISQSNHRQHWRIGEMTRKYIIVKQNSTSTEYEPSFPREALGHQNAECLNYYCDYYNFHSCTTSLFHTKLGHAPNCLR